MLKNNPQISFVFHSQGIIFKNGYIALTDY